MRGSNELFSCESTRCSVALCLLNIDHHRHLVGLSLARGALDVVRDEHGHDDCLFAEEVIVIVLRGILRTHRSKICKARPRLEGREPFRLEIVDRGSQDAGEVSRVRVQHGVVVVRLEVVGDDCERSCAPQKIALFDIRWGCEFDTVLRHGGAVF